jgi:uncharacterized protein (DUF697 family)
MTEPEETSERIVNRYVMWSMGAGFLPFPFVDLAAVTGIQLRMLGQLAEAHGVPFSQNRAKAAVGSLLGSVVPSTLGQGAVGSIIKAIPLLGPIAGIFTMPAFYGASTYAVGKIFAQHFASGGTFLDFDPSKNRKAFAEQLEEGKQVVSRSRAKGAEGASGLASA